ncbi:hypothetical protein ACFOW4_15160 [Micromonospora sp. GCM10011542]|uniref:hypothetical protein n=1 Tax=Micromonospora sp. GCM10011542 TaxID=3317337 RepID=UPI003611168F
MATVMVRDETATGRAIAQWPLAGLPERISARELVRLRVREEVARFNAEQAEHFRGLVQPTGTEATLNGYRVTRGRRLDWERQAEAACDAFARNGFVLLVGDRQIEDLDEEIDLRSDADIAFVRLVALVGG